MLEYCKCGSMLFKDSCTNKKCKHHIKGVEPATYKQIEFINELLEKLSKDESQYDFKEMTSRKASKIIDQLKGELGAVE